MGTRQHICAVDKTDLARPIVQLIKRFLESGGAVNYIQVGHRQTAIEYTIAGISKIHDANLDMLGSDPITSELEGTMQAWVVETLLQGAYVRRYHLWEKDCKAYFPAMAERNGVTMVMKAKGGQSFPELVKEILVAFGVAVPDDILAAIQQMRQRVNTMKHEAGLELEHFVTESEYREAISGVEGFWEHLAGHERFVP
jgi:hypothetical protein